MPQLPLLSVVGAASNAAAAVASTVQGDGNSNPFALYLVFDATFTGGTAPTLQLILEAFDPVSGAFVAWGTAMAAMSGGGHVTQVQLVAPALPAAQAPLTLATPFPVPHLWRVRTVAGGTIGTVSFTVTAYVNMNLQ